MSFACPVQCVKVGPLVLHISLVRLQVSGPHRAFHLPEILQDPPVPGALPVRRVPT